MSIGPATLPSNVSAIPSTLHAFRILDIVIQLRLRKFSDKRFKTARARVIFTYAVNHAASECQEKNDAIHCSAATLPINSNNRAAAAAVVAAAAAVAAEVCRRRNELSWPRAAADKPQ